jgi:vacuolar-type H+-ATPase subunit F/Vma7
LGLVLFGCGSGGGADNILGTASSGSSGSTSLDGSVRIGSGVGNGFVEGVLAAEETTLLSGFSTTITVNLVDSNDNALTDIKLVTFGSNCVSQGQASFDNAIVSSLSGLATTEYTPLGCTGTDQITASVTVNSVDITASVTVTIQADQVLGVQFVSATATQLSLKGLGGDETSALTFRLVGAQNAPIIGETVTFSVSPSTGGVIIVSGTESDVSDVSGEVSTIIRSGTTATTVEVTATHSASSTSGLSDDITISTGIPVADRFSLSVSDFAPLDAFRFDGIEVDFSIIASDQFGNPVPDGARVSFVAPESGQITPSCALIDGRCTVTWLSSAPRPADLRVSIIAFMNGAESFVDKNGNNIFDAADLNDFTDLPEPCVDENENSTCEPSAGEFFADANEDGSRTAADGVWNGPCLSAVNNAAICNTPESIVISKVAVLALSTNTPGLVSLGTFPAIGSSIDLTDGLVHAFTGMIIGDDNNNPLPTGTTITFSDPDGAFNFSGNSSVQVSDQAPTGPFGVSIITNGIPTPGGGRLVLNVDLPGTAVDAEFTWTTID